MADYETYLKGQFSNLKTVMDTTGCRPILFVGSGMSQRYIDAPIWEELLNEIINRNPNITLPLGYYKQDVSNLPEVASKLIEEYFKYAWQVYGDDTYPDYLYTQEYDKSIFLKYTVSKIIGSLTDDFKIEGHKYEEELRALSKLTPHAIITTNYDKLLENIFPSYNCIIGQQIRENASKSTIGKLHKIHGCVTKIEEIVISSEDYEKFTKQRKYLTAKLLTYFIENPIIFLGYSVSDSNIKNILSDIFDMTCINCEDEIVQNIWFVDWQKEQINSEVIPQTEKIINVGDNRNIRINYIVLNEYVELFETLYQGTYVDIKDLENLENVIYNIVKSKTISNLEVDVVSIKEIVSEKNIIDMLGLSEKIDSTNSKMDRNTSALNLSIISDPEQILTTYPYRITALASKLGFSHWNNVRTLINDISKKIKFPITENNNDYHIDVGMGKSKDHRYSMEMYELLNKYINNESVKLKTKGKIIEVKKDDDKIKIS